MDKQAEDTAMTILKVGIGIIIGTFIASHNPEMAAQIQQYTMYFIYQTKGVFGSL